jgi:hypothetical protein
VEYLINGDFSPAVVGKLARDLGIKPGFCGEWRTSEIVI